MFAALEIFHFRLSKQHLGKHKRIKSKAFDFPYDC